MSNPENAYDFIVVGAGPVGLSLALGLAREDFKILLLEKENSLSEHSKAPAIWSRTVEIFKVLGVANQFLSQGKTLSTIRLWDADTNQAVITFNLKEMSSRTEFPLLLILPQSQTERILLDELKKLLNVSIQFSSELIGIEQTEDHITARYTFENCQYVERASYLVGCDGAHSKVRDLLGYELEGETFSMKAALADIKLPDNPDYNFPRISDKDHLSLGIKISDEVWRLILPYPENEAADLEKRIQKSVFNLFGKKEFELIWKSEFNLHDRISSGFLDRRVLLAGDAAHLNSPVGGQGMNAGIQDSFYLKNLLLEAHKLNDPKILTSYAEIRLKTVKGGVNSFTRHLTKFIFIGRGRLVKTIMKTGSLALKIPRLRRRFLQKLMMLK